MSKGKKMLNPANSAYLLKPGHDQIFNEVNEWISDIEFYEIELSFLVKLLDKAFLRITKHQESEALELVEQKIKLFKEKTLSDLLHKILDFKNKLGEMNEDVFNEGELLVLIEQSEFRTNINSVTKQMMKLKKEVYDIVEKQMRIAKKINSDYEDGKLTL